MYCTHFELWFESCFYLSITIQNGETALDRASYEGHHKVVELLLGAGTNPDLQDKVRIGQDSGVHVNQDGMSCIL